MKKRAELHADGWTTSDGRIDFFRGDTPVATVHALNKNLEVGVAGITSSMKVRKITLLQDLDWLLLDFAEDSALHRVAVRFDAVDYDELNSGLLGVIGDRTTLYVRRNRPEKAKTHNKPSLLTPDPPPVPAATAQPQPAVEATSSSPPSAP
jgi:hypothetical protein